MRVSDRVATVLLATAVVCLLLVQILPVVHFGSGRLEPFHGYEIWAEVVEILNEFDDANAVDLVINTALVLGSTLVLVSPFVVMPVSVNRVLWWCLAICSGMAAVGVSGALGWILLTDPPDPAHWRRGAGFPFLMFFPLFHFAGVLSIRRRETCTDLAPEAEAR